MLGTMNSYAAVLDWIARSKNLVEVDRVLVKVTW